MDLSVSGSGPSDQRLRHLISKVPWLKEGTVGAARHNLVMGENEMVKIRFRLLQGADGYPPCDNEGLWATPLGGGAYRVANLPWFVPDVALGDVVRAVADGDGILWAVERTEESGNCTIRVAPLDVDQRTVFDTFGAMGVFGEGLGGGVDIVALNVPQNAEFRCIKTVLQQGEADGRWAYEEGSITRAWSSA